MTIEFLYFDGCPNHQKAYALLLEVLREEQQPIRIERIEIKDDADAQKYKFVGSPTIRIDGNDIDPSASENRSYVKACRVYEIEGRLSGLPTKEIIRKALNGR